MAKRNKTKKEKDESNQKFMAEMIKDLQRKNDRTEKYAVEMKVRAIMLERAIVNRFVTDNGDYPPHKDWDDIKINGDNFVILRKEEYDRLKNE